MMRDARRVLPACAELVRVGLCVQRGGRVRAAACSLASLVAFVVLAFGLCASSALAQDPSARIRSGSSKQTAFPEQPGGVFGKKPKIDNALPLYLQGDELIYDTKGNRVIARGNVEIFYNKNVLTADQVIYDQGANTLTATGNVELKDENGNVIRADHYTLTDDFRDGFVQSLSVVARDESRITADSAERREGNVTEFKNGTFTACKSDGNTPPLWCVGARKILHDQQAATITYHDAEFKLFGVTVVYLPYFQTPDPSVKRKSGFLAPEYGSSTELGWFVEVPYYFALAENYDFTLRPRYFSEQGVLWQGDWRHKLESGEYSVKLAAIDQQASGLPDTADGDLEGWRGSIETRGRFSLSSWWSYGWNAVIESDDTFRRYYKLDSLLLTDRVDDVWLKGLSERNYFGVKLYHFGGLTITDSDQAESVVHPVVDHNYVFNEPVFGGELRWNSNALSLSREDSVGRLTPTTQPTQLDQNMSRVISELKWRRRFTDAIGITYTPFGEVRGDLYSITDYQDALAPNEVIENETFARGLATGGATVSYPWVANTGSATHVVEPIGQIVAHSASSTSKVAGLPIEDAKSLIFDDTNLFETTKFSGYDRFETGVRANVGVQYTFQAGTGYARVLLGQSRHLSGDNPYANPALTDDDGDAVTSRDRDYIFSPRTGLETDTSDYVVGAYIAPVDFFRLVSQTRLDEDDFSVRRESLTGMVMFGPVMASTTYSFTDTVPELGITEAQEDIVASATVRLTDRWSIMGAFRYDLDEDRQLMDSIRLSYLDECFMLSATFSESYIVNADKSIEPDQTIMLRFEMKHIGGFNYETQSLGTLMGGEDTVSNQ